MSSVGGGSAIRQLAEDSDYRQCASQTTCPIRREKLIRNQIVFPASDHCLREICMSDFQQESNRYRVEALMEHCRALAAEIVHTATHAAHLLQAVLKDAFAPASIND
jgi:hypothetical protein